MPPPDEKAKKPKPPDEPADWHGKRRAKPSASGAAWQSSVRGLPDAQRSRPRALRLFLTGLLLVLVAVFVYLWGRTVSPTPLITFAFTDYQLPLPPNAWAFEDWDRFRIGSRPVSSRSNLAWIGLDTKDGPAPSQEAWLVRLKEKVENAKPEKGLPILVYLSAHGAVDDAGRPCLIAPGNESDRQNWSSVEDLVNALGNAAPKHKVVLFLDANRLPGHWALGLLYNDFADRLPSALDAAQAKNVLIVNSTSPGQVGWTSHKQGGSIFALCVLNGLRREASSNGKVVTLDDLLRFVRARGGDWAKTYRGVPQTPFLIPRDAKTDFKLAEVPSLWQEQFLAWITNKRSDEPAADRTDQFDEKIKKKLKEAEPLWDKLAKFAEAGGPSETFFEALRLRCELAHWQQRMAAGDREAELVKDDLEGLATRIRALEKATAEPPMSFSLWRNQVAPKLEEWRQCCASATVAELCKTIPTSATGGPEPIEWRWARLLADDQALRPAANEVLPLALNQRNLAEKAAWPRDARAYYAVRAYLDMVDEQRRGADDALFLGELKEAKSVYGDAKARYESAAELGEAISSAYRARNRAMYKLLDLAPSIDLALRFSNVGRMSQHGHDLLDVIEDARLLRDELEHIVNAKYDPPPDDPNELRMDSTWFRSQAEKLHDKGKDLSLTVDRLTAKLNSLAKWHEKTALNDGPDALWDLALSPAPAVVGGGEVLKRFYELVENEQRLNFDRLTPEERKQVERNEAQDEQAPRRQADGDANAKSDGPTSEAPRPPTWSRHPAAAILGLPKEAKTDAADYDQRRTAFHKQGREVFERLAFLRKKAVSAPSTREPLADDEAQILAAAELLAELALSDGSRSFVGCALQLARFDRGRFLTWQAQRALGDFWGPRAWQQEARDEPYYRQLAQAMLNEAGTPLDAASDLRKKLDRKYEFKLDLEEPDAPDTSSNRADGASMAIVKWNYTFQPPPPKGRAALFLLGADQNSPSAGQRRSVDLSPSDLPPSHEQEIELAGTTDTSTLRLLFRGHVDDQRVPRRRARPKRQIVHTGTKNADVTIKVRQEEPLDLQVVFLLDCSGSMESAGKKLKAFLNGKNGPTRMDAAKQSLEDLLEGLADQRDIKVGLSLFGATHHPDAEPSKNWDAELAAEKARQGMEITSGNDLLSIIPLRAWGPMEFQNFKTRFLWRINARGQTPLYFAIAETLRREFPERTDGKRQVLVIISDGENLVGGGDRNAEMTESPQVAIDALDDKDWLEVYVLNCGDNAGIQGKLTKEVFKKLKKNKNWHVFKNPPADVDEFSERMRDALGVRRYEYKELGASPGKELSGKLWVGQQKPFKISKRTPFELFEAVKDGRGARRFLVEGGERVIWTLTKGGDLEYGRLEKYDNSKREAKSENVANPLRLRNLGDDLDPATFHVAADVTSNGAGDPEFRIAIQNGNGRAFSPRPFEAWVEIMPRRGEDAQPDPLDVVAYHFCDVTYDQNDSGAPVLFCAAHDWPRDAKQAEIRLWWSMQEKPDSATSLKEYQVQQLKLRPTTIKIGADQIATISAEVPIAKAPDRGASLIVTEEHLPDADYQAVRVESVEPPDETKRRFFPPVGKLGWRVEHEFVFFDENERAVRNFSVRIAPRRLLMVDDDRAAHVEKLIVTIP